MMNLRKRIFVIRSECRNLNQAVKKRRILRKEAMVRKVHKTRTKAFVVIVHSDHYNYKIKLFKILGDAVAKQEEATDIAVPKKLRTRGKKRKATQDTKRKADKLRKLMKTAVRKATCANPSLFELPKSYQVNPYNFPGEF